MLAWILFTLSFIVNIALAFFLRTYITRLFQYDDLYQILIDDVEANLKQFDRMRKSSFLSDDDEVQKAHKSMMFMASRMDEFANQMEEIGGKKLRKVTRPMTPINVTKEADKLG